MAISFVMPLLLQAAAVTAAPQAAPQQLAATETNAAVSTKDKMICKRQVRTGTLAGYERICRTKAEWQAASERARDEWQEIQGTKGSSRDGG